MSKPYNTIQNGAAFSSPNREESTFGKLIREGREAKKMNRTELAKMIDIDHQVLWSIENSSRLPFKKTGVILDLANALDLPPEDLMEKAFSERLARKKVSDYIKIDTDDLTEVKKKVVSMLKMIIGNMSDAQAGRLLSVLFDLHKEKLEETKS